METTGLYKVGQKFFKSKFDAVIESSSSKEPLTYYYYDEIWDLNVNKYPTIGVDLLNMYKIRAQQLRDKYDYLTLHFSGGSDSTTVLQSFVLNNIKLDEVYVKWPTKLLGSSIYTPNNTDTSPTNMLSEWDYSIKPKLEWLKSAYPDIKITIEDWTEELYKANSSIFGEKLFFMHNHNFGLVNFIFSEMLSKSSVQAQNKGLRVGHIYGAEKPLITYVSDIDSFYMYFTDASTTAVGFQHAFNRISLDSKIDFYNAPEYPELTISRAKVMSKYLRHNPSLIYLVDYKNRSLPSTEKTKLAGDFQKLCSTVLYPNWNPNTFQVDKTDVSNRLYHPWYHYVFDTPEFKDKEKNIAYTLKDISQGIHSQFLTVNDSGEIVGLRPISTKFFKLNE